MRVVALAACLLAHGLADEQCLEACTTEGASCSITWLPVAGHVWTADYDVHCTQLLINVFYYFRLLHPIFFVDNCFCWNCVKSTDGKDPVCDQAFSTGTTSSSTTTAAPGSNSAASASETSSTSVHYLWLLLLAVVILVFIVTIAIRYRRFTGQNDNKENVENSQMGATDQSGEDKADIESPQVEANDRKEDEKDEVEHL
eukprot:GEMP01083873.1.p1 GENE.GEMP01083873.1~~GEMP01083873.1.p1  ORF type:complete len:200 (+),score=39.52 GEMP01083873.1:108-707(+)